MNDKPTQQAAAERLAQAFHDTYERLAPSFGYETRPDTKVFDADSPNGKLMIAVINHVLADASVLLDVRDKQMHEDGYTIARLKQEVTDAVTAERQRVIELESVIKRAIADSRHVTVPDCDGLEGIVASLKATLREGKSDE